jgi:hypothetical protein
MPVWPKFFYTFGVNMKTAGTEWKLRKKTGAAATQERVFRNLIDRLAGASFWKHAGIEHGMSYAQFQSRVRLHTHAQLADEVEQMKRGAKDVLWPGRCSLFALTSGTTTGTPKTLPVTEEMLAHVRRAGMDALLYYTVRVRHAGAFRGRHLLLGGSTDLAPIADMKERQAYEGALSGIVAVDLPAWAEKHLYEPGPRVARNDNWDAKLTAIVERTVHRDISLIAGIPTWVIPFIDAVRGAAIASGQRLVHLEQLWPNLECLVHTGVPIKPFTKWLHAALGPHVKFHEVYAASEGFIAAQDSDRGDAMRLMVDMGLFFEFLPMSEFDPTRLEQLGPRTISLANVKTDTDYAIVLTTPGGLARYVLGDVVRFTSLEPPRLIYIGRTELQLNAWGERVMEKDITDTLVHVCSTQDWDIVNFHVAPIFGAPSLTGQSRGRHEWWIEIRPGTVTTPIGPQIATALDTELRRVHEGYAVRRKSGTLDMPTVRLVMPGVFEHWLRYQKKWGGQNKLPRCRSDRLIADELAQVTNFAQD